MASIIDEIPIQAPVSVYRHNLYIIANIKLAAKRNSIFFIVWFEVLSILFHENLSQTTTA